MNYRTANEVIQELIDYLQTVDSLQGVEIKDDQQVPDLSGSLLANLNQLQDNIWLSVHALENVKLEQASLMLNHFESLCGTTDWFEQVRYIWTRQG